MVQVLLIQAVEEAGAGAAEAAGAVVQAAALEAEVAEVLEEEEAEEAGNPTKLIITKNYKKSGTSFNQKA
jgi:hypothetical protein